MVVKYSINFIYKVVVTKYTHWVSMGLFVFYPNHDLKAPCLCGGDSGCHFLMQVIPSMKQPDFWWGERERERERDEAWQTNTFPQHGLGCGASQPAKEWRGVSSGRPNSCQKGNYRGRGIKCWKELALPPLSLPPYSSITTRWALHYLRLQQASVIMRRRSNPTETVLLL